MNACPRLALKLPRSKVGRLSGFRNLWERVLAVSTIAPLFVGALLSVLSPTIGIILCKSKNKTIAEYALRGLHKPIAVATHKLPDALQDELPSPEQLTLELDNAVQKLEAASEVIEVKAQSEETTAVPEKLAEAALEIQRLIKLLQATNPAASNEEAKAFVTAAIPLTLRQQAASAFQSLDKAALQRLL